MVFSLPPSHPPLPPISLSLSLSLYFQTILFSDVLDIINVDRVIRSLVLQMRR